MSAFVDKLLQAFDEDLRGVARLRLTQHLANPLPRIWRVQDGLEQCRICSPRCRLPDFEDSSCCLRGAIVLFPRGACFFGYDSTYANHEDIVAWQYDGSLQADRAEPELAQLPGTTA